MDEPILIFEPISLFSAGALAEIIGKSYSELVEKWPDAWEREHEKWEDFDRQAFAHPDTVGKCVFVSRFGDRSIGLASYDPRPGPSYAVIGQNCVLPEFRGRGFGEQQILEILRRFRGMNIGRARVVTSEHPFFRPAEGLYRSLGFQEVRRFAGGPDRRYQLIELEMGLLSEIP